MMPAWAQEKPTLRFAAVFSDKDIRADMTRMIAKDVEGDYKIRAVPRGDTFQAGHGASWRCSGTTWSWATSAPQDISKQVPAWVGADLRLHFPRRQPRCWRFFASDIGAQMKKQAEDQLKIKILGPTF